MSETLTSPGAEPSQPVPDDAGRSASVTGKILRWSCIWLPCVYLVLLVGRLVTFDLPNNFDRLDESYEPLKTLKFVHSRGHALEKWGPMPNFLYAPIYAAPLAYWYLTGDLSRPSTDYPYGFKRPFEQQGLLIVLGRLVGLVVGIASMAFYGRALYRFTGSALAVFLVLTLFMATSPELALKFVSTKPDGLMVAFLAVSMALYADIIARGLTRRRGIWLSLFAVFSVSCKELTVLAYVPIYGGLAAAGWIHAGGEPARRRRFLVDFAITVAGGLVAYLLANVVYAPATWLERMEIYIIGPGKDPNVWAPPGYTLSAYLRDTFGGLLFNLGPGGLAIVAAALLIALVAPVRHRLLTWLPSVGFLVLLLATAGYMPSYFLCPLDVTLALPVAASLAYAERHWIAGAPRLLRAAVAVPVVVLCLANAWQGNLAWGRAEFSAATLEERYCKQHVNKADLIHTGNFWVRQSGADRLSYLGFNVDDRPLGALMERPDRMPDVILMTTGELHWIQEFKLRPARNKMMEDSGYSYNRFDGPESLGYRHVDTVRPEPTWLTDVPWYPWHKVPANEEVYVYRKDAGR